MYTVKKTYFKLFSCYDCLNNIIFFLIPDCVTKATPPTHQRKCRKIDTKETSEWPLYGYDFFLDFIFVAAYSLQPATKTR